ncbi:MAG: hypothetical protein ACYS22_04490 [Planctomycetota bacterium]
MSKIDLENVGQLAVTAKNAKDYTFYLLLENSKYTKDALAADAGIIKDCDVLFKQGPVADEEGRALVDLACKKDEIIDKLKKAKKPAKTKGMIAVISTSKDDNKDPSKKEADVKKVSIERKADEIKVKGIKLTGAKADWVAYHHPILFAELEVSGDIKEVEVTYGKMGNIMSMFASWEQADAGTAKCKKLVLGSCGDPHAANNACPNPPNFHKRSWWSGVPGWNSGKVKMKVEEGKKYVLGIYPRGNGCMTLKVQGTGAKSCLSGSVQMSMAGHPRPGD